MMDTWRRYGPYRLSSDATEVIAVVNGEEFSLAVSPCPECGNYADRWLPQIVAGVLLSAELRCPADHSWITRGPGR